MKQRGKDYSLSVISREAAYHESQLVECIKAAYYNDYTDESEEITVDGTPARIGSFTMDNCETHFIYTLKNGIFYGMELSMYEGNSYPEGYLETLAETIVFDESLLKPQTANCGDVKVTVPGHYIAFDSEKEDEFYDEHYFAKYGKTDADELQYSIYYSKGKTLYGYNAKELLEEIISSYEDKNSFTMEGSIGTFECASGAGSDGYIHNMAAVQYKDNIYWMEITSVSELTKEDWQNFIGSVGAKE